MLVQVPSIRAVTDSTGDDPKVWMMMQSYTNYNDAGYELSEVRGKGLI
jgi:hypothetical protein